MSDATTPIKLHAAKRPQWQQDVLALLEELRADVEAGRCLSIVATPVGRNKDGQLTSTTRWAGDVDSLQLVGLLFQAIKDMTP